MPPKHISVGRHELKLRGDEVVDERNPLLGKTEQTIIPLNAISSIDVTKSQSIKALLGAGFFVLVGLSLLTNGSAGWGLGMLGLAGLFVLGWMGSRSYELIVESATGKIEVEGSASDRTALEDFASYLRDQRRGRATGQM